METTKQCTKCEQIKDISEYGYYKDRGTYKTHCKTCVNERIREYYRLNPEKRKEKNDKYNQKKEHIEIEYYEENKEYIDEQIEFYAIEKEKIKAIEKEEQRLKGLERERLKREANREEFNRKAREYRENNRERVQALQRAWIDNNRDHIKAKQQESYANRDDATIKALAKKQREYYEANKERMNAMSKAYNKEYRYTENGRLVRLACGNRRRVRKRRQGDGTIPQTITHPLASDLQELLDRQDHKCNNCGTHISREKKNIELDHHFPISKDGQDSICNVVWLCKQCNRSKSANMPDTLMMVW